MATLLREFLRHEDKRVPTPAAAEAVARRAFDPDTPFQTMIAEVRGRAAGYLALYNAFSLFKGGRVVIVENLFVYDWARGLGVGRSLMAAAAAEARRRGATRMEMNVRDDREETRTFYERLGAHPAGEVVYRVEDAALAALASDSHGGGPA